MNDPSLVGTLAVCIGLYFVYALAFGGRSFSSTRAKTRVRSVEGPNLGTMLAVVALGALVLDATSDSRIASLPFAGPVIAVGALILILVIVRSPGLGNVVLAGLGIAVLAVTVGSTGVITLVILVALLLWLLGAIRGWSK